MSSFKKVAFFLIFATLLSLVASCSTQPPPLADEARNAEIVEQTQPATLRVAMREGPVSDGISQALQEWQAMTGISVEIHAFSHSYLQEEIFLDVETNTGKYDVVLIDDPWFPSLAGNDYLMPLSSFDYQADPDFVIGSLEMGMWPPPRGPRPPGLSADAVPQLFALPLVGNVQLFWYNQDLIPQEPQSIGELITVLNETSQANNLFSYSYTGNAGNPIVTEFNAWNWSYGGEIFDDRWGVVINQEASVQALTDWLTVLNNASASTRQYTSSTNTGREVLQSEALASMVWPANIPSLYATYPDAPNMNVIALPAGTTQTSQIGHWLLAIPTTAKNKQEAYNFILWATGADAMRLAAGSGLPPTRTSLLQNQELVSQYAWFPEIEAAINNGTWRPRTPLWTKVEHILGTYLAQAASGQLTPQEALDQAAAEIEGIMEKANYYN